LIGGGGVDSEIIKYDVLDMPGEAGTVFSRVSPVPSYQDLRFFSSLNPDALNDAERLRWNQPQMQGHIIIGASQVPEAVVLKMSVVALDGDLALDLHRMPETVVLKTPVVALDGVMDRDPGIFQQASGG
jgi:hypothetical protein